jgi:hypothetical protein
VLLRCDNCRNFHFLPGHNSACEAHITEHEDTWKNEINNN